MSHDEVAQKVMDIIAESLGVKRTEVVAQASFITDLNADSLDIVELVMAIEKEFDIEIPDDEAEKIRTVQDAIDYIVAHVS
jgi:acyl carrier protein